jgi:hypothetical protein
MGLSLVPLPMLLFILGLICIGVEMLNLEIPDPFQTFVAKKYANYKGMVYDFFAKEWYLKTACCGEELYAPNKKTMTKIRLYHSRNECLGGY